LLAAASLGAAQAQAPESEEHPEACGTVEHCIARLTGTAGDRGSVSPVHIGDRLYGHGRAGADALVPLLSHPSEDVRRDAATALDQFEELRPRHAATLIAAHRRGLDVARAIARTGSDEALRYLEAAWSAEGERYRVREALTLFEERAQPFLLRELERCRQGCSREEAQSLIYALGRLDGPIPNQAMAVIRDVAASESAAPELRREMEDQLIGSFDRAALPILVRRLDAARGTADEDLTAARLIDAAQHHNEAARPAVGPLVRSYLRRPELRRARIEAVITSVVTRDRRAIPALREVLADAEADWLAAYNALWALAELDAQEARPRIARLSRDHWYQPVRNSARRALAMLDGGAFELPELGDEDRRGPYVGELRFAADIDAVRDCRFDRAAGAARVGRDGPVVPAWPQAEAVRIALEPPTLQARAVLGAVPDLPAEAAVTLLWQRGGERIVGIDADRWNGGLFAVDADGTVRRLLADNVVAVFELQDGLLVATGRAGDWAFGDLWRLDGRGRLAIIGRPLRLPAYPEGFAVASDRTLVIRTERGDVAVNQAGRLLPPRPCAAAAMTPAQ
jgi:hypothetical protein